MKNILNIKNSIAFLFFYLAGISMAAATPAQYPLLIANSADPNILFNMSVETPMGGAAYNDQPDSDGCSGRVNDGGTVGICYFKTKTYLGYFDPNKCYAYSSGRFNPVGLANSDHECTAKFSGNFMNWSTMTAMDMFVWTMTGGNRIDDGADTTTVIRRARKQNNNSWFPHKLISSTRNVEPSTVTPWGNNKIYIFNTDFGVQFGTSREGSDKGTYNVNIRVCDQSVGLEENCVPYNSGSYYKPEGIIQKKADHMRFGVTSYSNTNGNGIDGGVLRSNMKYVGAMMPDGSGGITANPNAEIMADGTINNNPNAADASASGVSKSGVIPYLNKFSDASYKGNDPASELFYESIRYFKNLGPTAEYLAGANGGFPILNASRWQDPIQYSCQKNFIIGINDANPWKDKKLPGTFFTSSSFNGESISDDFGEPSTPDPDINVTALTNTVGDLEGLTGTSQCIGCTASNCDMDATDKTITGLGEVFGTCPYVPKENSYYIAGLAYYANTQDIRTGTGGAADFSGKQTVSTFMIDTQEYSNNPLVGQMNMLWLAGKYGGFVDENDNNQPDLASEWDSDSDGEPDNYVLATQPTKLVTALNAAFNDIESRSGTTSAVATNSTRLNANSKIYQSSFNSTDWSGNLFAFPLNSDGTISNTAAWNATSGIPAENARKIFSYNPDLTLTNKGIVFEWANLNASQKAFLNTDSYGNVDTSGSDRLNYIRGDKAKELLGSGSFRDRGILMGDIVNSDPWFMGGSDDFGYSILPSAEGSSYVAFKQGKASKPSVLLFGANDGMMHAIVGDDFDQDTAVDSDGDGDAANDADIAGGTELFTYIPDFVISKLSALTDPNYGCISSASCQHRYYVDGSVRQGDAYFGTTPSWHSVIVGTLGAGGKAIFAIDATNPNTQSASDILWEISTTQAYNSADLTNLQSNLGFTLPKASIVRMQNGSWAAIVANGYDSADKKAVLFIIDIETGEIIKTLDTLIGDASTPNGLSTPIPVDVNGDRIADYIYAGDLLGNMWKFDVSTSNANHWDIAYSSGSPAAPAPLFTACNEDPCVSRQPITAKPQVGKHPDGGLMVYFGTGKYYEAGDQNGGSSSQIQTFYGIRDNGAVIAGRDSLQAQTILAEVEFVSFGKKLRVTSDTIVDYASKKGWYLDLVSPVNGTEGELVTVGALLRAGRIIFTTIVPTQDPCVPGGGFSWLMEIDAVTGQRLDTAPFDINGDGKFTIEDYILIYDTDGDGDVDGDDGKFPPSGITDIGQGIVKGVGVITCEDGVECKYTIGSSGKKVLTKESTDDPTGRQSWRQLR
jgi:type IV pilus assembly protein PilY1